MRHICAVLGCKTGSRASQAERRRYGLRRLTLFRVPKSVDRQRQWKDRLGIACEETDVICELHFRDEDIIRENVFTIQGRTQVIPRERYDLRKDAVPENRTMERKDDSALESSPVCGNSTDMEIVDREFNNDLIQGEIGINEANGDDECDVADNQPDDVPNRFALHNLVTMLEEKALPKTWSWTTSPSNTNELMLIQVHPATLKLRVYLLVHIDLSVMVRTSDGLRDIKLETAITSASDLMDLLKKIGTTRICDGSGIDHRERSENCALFISDSYQRVKVVRCEFCQKLRRIELKKKSGATTKLKFKYARSKQILYNQQRQYRRQMMKLEMQYWGKENSYETF